MSLPLLTRHLVEKKLTAYCDQKVPAHARHQVRLTFEIDGNKVTLIEERDAFAQPGTWTQMPIAQFRFTSDTAIWTLYCPNFRKKDAWRIYPEAKPGKDFDALVKAVDEDKLCAFWG